MLRAIKNTWARPMACVLPAILLTPCPAAAQVRLPLRIDNIVGAPSSVPVRRTQRTQVRYVVDRKRVEEAYGRGYAAAQKKAAEQLARALPAPMVARASPQPLPPPDATPPATPTTHVYRQSVEMQFLNPRKEPVVGLEVVPVVSHNPGEEERLPAVRTDMEGRISVKDVVVAEATSAADAVPAEAPVVRCAVRIELPSKPALELPREWRYRDPSDGFLNMAKFEGKQATVARRPTTGVQLASAAPHLLRLGVLGASARTPGAAGKRANGRRTPVTALQLQAGASAQKARTLLDAALRLLEEKDISQAPEGTRKHVESFLRDARAAAEKAAKEAPSLVRAHQYAAEALLIGGDRNAAVRRLTSVPPSLRKHAAIRKQLENYKGMARVPSAIPEVPKPVPAPTPKTVVHPYVYAPAPVIVERTVVDLDLQLPEGAEDARITVPQPSGPGAGAVENQLRRDGRVARVQLAADLFTNGPLPIIAARTTAGGELESVTENYPAPDPYAATNVVAIAPLRLARITDAQPPRGVDVLAHLGAARQVFTGLPQPGRRNQKDKKSKNGAEPAARPEIGEDGSWWVADEAAGVEFRVRRLPAGIGAKPSAPNRDEGAGGNDGGIPVIESIRLDSPDAGTMGGVRVGDEAAAVTRSLGPPEAEADGELSYLQRGLRYRTREGRVEAIEIARPTRLLREGTTAFVARRPVQVFLDQVDVNGPASWSIRDRKQLAQYLGRAGVARLVERPESADYKLSVRLADFQEKADQALDLVPLKYECSATMVFSLYDSVADRWLVQDERLEAQRKANWIGEFGAAVVGGILAGKLIGGKMGAILGAVLGGGGIAALRASMGRARERSPRLLEETLYSRMLNRISDEIDYTGRVTALDYARGTATVNIGTEDGITPPSGGQEGTWFEVQVAGNALPGLDEDLKAEFWVLEVISATAHESQCRLMKVSRKVGGHKKTALKTEVQADPETLKQIPRAETAVVSVRVRNRLVGVREL